MQISFAIITDGSNDARIAEIIASIHALAIPEYEIIISGGRTTGLSDCRHLPHDEDAGQPESSRQRWWITGKKNAATRAARYPIVVYLHDYHVFDADWYRAMVAFGDDFDVCQHRILTQRGNRMFDWLTFDHPTAPVHSYVPYDRTDCIPYQYISGGYWVAKRQFMLDQPLDETLYSGQAEDVEWSKRIRIWANIRMNRDCVVRHNKLHREANRAAVFESIGFPW